MTQDFVDYFFQKEGDTYIAALAKSKQENDERCERLLASADESVRNKYKAFKLTILDVGKIAPNQGSTQNFDFIGTLTAAFDGLEMNIKDSLDAIQKYYEFTQNMYNHWQGLEVDAGTVLVIGVQMMATIESMVYPLFLKMTEFIGGLAANANNNSTKNTPEEMMLRLHKLAEALMVEIAAIGTSCVATLGRSSRTSEGQLRDDSAKLGSQGRYAKNCIAWAMKAVSSVILHYFLLLNPSTGKATETAGLYGSGMCTCKGGQSGRPDTGCSLEAEERRIKELAQEGERRIRERAEEAENRIVKRMEEGDRRLKERTEEAEERIRKATPCTGESRGESRPKKEKKAKEPEPEPEKPKKKERKEEPESEAEKPKKKERKEEPESEAEKPKKKERKEKPESEAEKPKKKEKAPREELDEEEKKKRRRERRKKKKEQEKEKERLKEQEQPKHHHHHHETKPAETAEADKTGPTLDVADQINWNTQSRGQGVDFVDFFFQKDGLKFIAILSEAKRKYESRCKDLLAKVGATTKNDARKFMTKVHEARKVEAVTKEVEVKDFAFSEAFAKDLDFFKLDCADKIEMLHKYNEYVRGMFRHWEYRIEKDRSNKLEPQTVIENGTQMMATTMSLTYPIFIIISEFLARLTKTASESKLKFPPEEVTQTLHKIVVTNAIEMAAIGISCINTIAKIPDLSKDDLKKNSSVISIQAKFAKNAIAWAMKSVSPLLLLYFLRCATEGGDSKKGKEKKSRSKPKSDKTGTDGEGKSKKKRKKRSKKKPKKGAGGGAKEQKKETGDESQSQSQIQKGPSQKDGDAVPEKKKKRKKRKKKPEGSGAGASARADRPPTGTDQDIYRHPKKSHDFVDYFFQKDGEKFLAVLTDVRRKYEEMCNSTLPNAAPGVKKKTRAFLLKVHEARKVAPIKKEVEIEDLSFVENVQRTLAGLDVDMKENILTLQKYNEFCKNMVVHWKYRVKNQMELDPDAVVEVGVQMMATTVALSYPCFMKVADMIGHLSKDPKPGKSLAPEKIIDRLHRFVEILTTTMASIGMSCINTLAILPGIKKEDLQVRSDRLAHQTKYANNSIAWAMKSMGPLLLYYFIKYESA